MTIPFSHYLNIRSASSPSLRGDGGRLAFLTDVTGTAQLWTLDDPMGWPRQRTFFEDRLMFASYHPERDLIAFGKDEGGDERQRIHVVEGSGGPSRQISPTDAKHLWGGWSPDGSTCAWAHNGRNGRDFDLYLYDLDADEEERILEVPGFNYVAEWMPSSDGLIVGRAASNVDNDLWHLDLESGDRTHLTPHEGDARYQNPVVLPDESGCFLLSNEDRDVTNLARYDFESEELTFVDDHDWNREGLALSDDGRWLVVVTNEEGYSTVEIRDRETDERRQLDELGHGVVGGFQGGVHFQPDASTLVLPVSPADDTTDAYTVDAATGDVTRWTESSTAGVPRESLIEPELVSYESFDDLEIPAFYYRPPEHRGGDDGMPVIVDIHGGPEAQYRPQLRPTTQYYLQRGFAVFAPNVRGSAGYGQHYMSLDDVRNRMDSVADIRAARDWLVEEGGADPDRIGLIGGSYGGFMVLSSMVTYPDLWAAGVDVVGVASFVTFLENTSDYRRHLREAEYGSLDEDREFLEEISPINHVDEIAAPLMVIHGENDPRVPVGEARQIVEAVREQGLPVESLIYEDEGHGLAKRKNRLDAYPQVAEFFEEHLG